ncbi:MAG: AMP-binding protein [Elusimicrobia bacterium]|nr:AMP-binding protein [Elusimicrobiota bacterium]
MDSRLRRQWDYVLGASAYYGPRLRRWSKVRTPAEFAQVPLTTKADILADQERHPPFGGNLCVPPAAIVRVHKTSGTTDKPVIIAMTAEDIRRTVRVGAACFRGAGLRPGDIVAHCLNYNMWAGGYTDHQSLEEAGATVVPFGVGNSRLLIETILHLRVTALHCTPSYLSKLEAVLHDEFRMEPRGLKLRLGLFGAESGLQNPEYRKGIEDAWGLKAMNANYGMSEVLSMFGAECARQNGLHFMGAGVLLPELIDPKTRAPVPIEEGAAGELVLTNLCRQAQPLIRYRTGDMIKVLAGRCPCKSASFRFEVVGRSDDMLVIKGLNVFPGQIREVIRRRDGGAKAVYQVQVSKGDPIDAVTIVLERAGGCRGDARSLRDRLAGDFTGLLGLRPRIEFVPRGSLPRTDGKTKEIHRVL